MSERRPQTKQYVPYNNTQNIKYKSKQDIKWQSCKGDLDDGIINELSR